MKYICFILSSLFLGAFIGIAPAIQAGEIEGLYVDNAWMRFNPASGRPSALYMSLKNNGEEMVHVVGALSDDANNLMIHESKLQDGHASMAHVNMLMIGAEESLSLAPGGYHIMVLGLNDDIAVGQTFGFSLQLDDGSEVWAEALVCPINATQHCGDTDDELL